MALRGSDPPPPSSAWSACQPVTGQTADADERANAITLGTWLSGRDRAGLWATDLYLFAQGKRSCVESLRAAAAVFDGGGETGQNCPVRQGPGKSTVVRH